MANVTWLYTENGIYLSPGNLSAGPFPKSGNSFLGLDIDNNFKVVNSAGVVSALLNGSLTTGTLPVSTGAGTLGDSIISQAGGIATIAGSLNLSTGGFTTNFLTTGTSTLSEINTTNIGYQLTSANGLFRLERTTVGPALIYVNNGPTRLDFSASATGLPHLTILPSGFVGVGTTSPNILLTVQSTATTSDSFEINSFSPGGSIVAGHVLSTPYFYMQKSGATTIRLDTGGDSFFTGGNIGIGITTPAEKLDIFQTPTSIRSTVASAGPWNFPLTVETDINNRGIQIIQQNGTFPRLGIYSNLNGDVVFALNNADFKLFKGGTSNVEGTASNHLVTFTASGRASFVNTTASPNYGGWKFYIEQNDNDANPDRALYVKTILTGAGHSTVKQTAGWFEAIGAFTGTNIGIYAAASGGSVANNAIIVPAGGGNVGLGLNTPTSQLHIQGSGSTNATKSLIIQNSLSVTSFSINDAGVVSAIFGYSQGANLILFADGASTRVGVSALANVTTGISNTAVGIDALLSTTIQNNNTAVGASALQVNTGYDNTAVGAASLQNNTTGQTNCAFGSYAMAANTTGNANTVVGYSALGSSIDADSNTSIGAYSLKLNTHGAYNTAIGSNAGGGNITSDKNTYIGWNTGATSTGARNVLLGANIFGNVNIDSGSDNIFIGQGIDFVNTFNNLIIIGSTSTATANAQAFIGNAATRTSFGGGSPDPFALVDFNSTTAAVLLPRMTTAQKTAITPQNGMVVYDLTLNKFQGYENGAWVNLV